MIARMWHGTTKVAYYEMAKYYPQDQQYLLEFEEKVIHFEVFAEG